ncbi:MAG: hypothetical protein JXR12_06105 [Neptunomonas phycophila]|uniref:hypothetical protein n=1 Tax=Neptunomonas phycophila TaxID=1572645 RepID=UPI003B8DCB30
MTLPVELVNRIDPKHRVCAWVIHENKHGRYTLPKMPNNNLELKQLVVESVLMNMTLPQIIAVEDNLGGIELRDLGIVQSVIEYIDGEFPITNNVFFKDLEPLHQGRIEDFEFNIVVIQPPTSTEKMDELISRYYKLLTLLTQ